MSSKKMTKQDKLEWAELYDFVKNKVLEYDDNQSLSRTQILRLKGLATSNYISNKNIKKKSNYSFKVVLNTFKSCIPQIDIAKKNCFNDETHKFNYILKIVENNINDIYLRMKHYDENQTLDIDTSSVEKYVNTFNTKKEKKIDNHRYDDLW